MGFSPARRPIAADRHPDEAAFLFLSGLVLWRCCWGIMPGYILGSDLVAGLAHRLFLQSFPDVPGFENEVNHV